MPVDIFTRIAICRDIDDMLANEEVTQEDLDKAMPETITPEELHLREGIEYYDRGIVPKELQRVYFYSALIADEYDEAEDEAQRTQLSEEFDLARNIFGEMSFEVCDRANQDVVFRQIVRGWRVIDLTEAGRRAYEMHISGMAVGAPPGVSVH